MPDHSVSVKSTNYKRELVHRSCTVLADLNWKQIRRGCGSEFVAEPSRLRYSLLLNTRYKPRYFKESKMPGSERRRELRRRRHRSKKIPKLKQRAEKANPTEKKVIAEKLRLLTPGANDIIRELELEK